MTGLPQGWALAPINTFARSRSGNSKLIKGQQAQEPAAGLFPAFSASGQDVWVAVPEHEGNAIIISAVGARCGKTFRATGQWSAVANTHIVWPEEIAVDTDWLQLLLNDENFWEKGGSAQPFVKVNATFEREIPLPPLPEQRRIVRKLDTLSARSTTARTHLSIIEKLVERYKSSVLISIFSGAATSKKMTTLDKVGKLVCGQSPASATVNRDGFGTPYCTGPEQWDGLSIHLDKWTTDPKRIVNEESIFITVKGSGVGTLFPGTQCAIGRDVYAYVPDQDRLDWRFAFWALRYEIASILINVKGLIPGLSKPDILDNPVFVPNLDEQREIVRRIETAFAKIDCLAAEAAKALKLLGHLDQRILAKAFAGDLVPQDPNDEPAETLLARIREARASAPKRKPGRKFGAS